MEHGLPHRTLMSLLIAGTALCASAATQAGSQQAFVLTAYSDAVGGEQLLSGRYSAALVKIRGAQSGAATPEVVRKTNACVAYAMLRKLREANAACNAAVIAATADRLHATGIVSRSRLQEDSTVAIAFSNRAIVHALSNEAVGSAEDLAEAYNLTPQSDSVVRNIAAFRQPPSNSSQLTVAARLVDD